MIGLAQVYMLVGLFLAAAGVIAFRDEHNPRRRTSGLFWGLLAAGFLAGDALPDEVLGGMLIVLALIAGSGGLRAGIQKPIDPQLLGERAARLGHRLLLPVLLVSLVTLAIVLGGAKLRVMGVPLVSPVQTTVVALGIACVCALLLGLRITRASPREALEGGRSLLEAIGWAALLPLLLAVLGNVFTRAGVGELLSSALTANLPLGHHGVAMLTYAAGMALLTMVMGNAFAAFPVIAIGIGLPVLVSQHHADPAPLAALGMLAGYCGTLLTPMAANFNIVPVALLGLRDQHAVIRAQAMTALPLFACNLALLFMLA
jgi:uncharacterized membrane protein